MKAHCSFWERAENIKYEVVQRMDRNILSAQTSLPIPHIGYPWNRTPFALQNADEGLVTSYENKSLNINQVRGAMPGAFSAEATRDRRGAKMAADAERERRRAKL